MIVKIGSLELGNGLPVRVQTMTNTLTQDVDATVAQTIRCIEAGAELVRITTPTLEDVEALKKIRDAIRKAGYNQPLIADVHFNPKVAEAAARVVEKVRINPGNYADKKTFQKINFSDQEYQEELERIHERILPLLNICREHGTAIRIGVNHGSLSDRIMSRYGDTPLGMVESAMEFVRICKSENFHSLVLSMKASNTRIMVYATRLLYRTLQKEGGVYPIHLGVTEAGEGEDGRIKSASGISSLLADGIGHTLRVSLTEDPEKEIPVAKTLVRLFERSTKNESSILRLRYDFVRRESLSVFNAGGRSLPVVIANKPEKERRKNTFSPEFLYLKNPNSLDPLDPAQMYLCDHEAWVDLFQQHTNVIPLVPARFFFHWRKTFSQPAFLMIEPGQLSNEFAEMLQQERNAVLVLQSFQYDPTEDFKKAFQILDHFKIALPVILNINLAEEDLEQMQIRASAQAGPLLIDGLGDGIWLRNAGNISVQHVESTAMGILQACRLRTFRTEYISCPSCGRTLFNICDTLQKIREKTQHLKHLKIGVMGCIVNGPGEMADADYGYVGAGSGKVNLYKGKEVVRKNISQDQAVDELIRIIKENGDWREPEQ